MTKDNWILLDSFQVSDFMAEIFVYQQKSTGLRLLWARSQNDPEMFGSFCFPTYPQDSTGVAHILEHSVLCGSQRFPGTSTFFQLNRSSLNSFLNAMTYPNSTLYPFGSPQLEDFKNLFEVYLDAVFFPLLREATFLQEGWRLLKTESGWDLTGVVYNEMRGEMASLERLAFEAVTQNLWSQGPLSVNSGGDPLEIPKLTWEGLKAFHQRWYHPSQALVYLYGEFDPHYFFARLDELLKGFTPQEPAQPVAPQPRRQELVQLESTYPASDNDSSALVLGWLAEEADNELDGVALDVLSSLLMGEGGLIKEAVLKSGLAQEVDRLSDRSKHEREGLIQIGFSGVEPKNFTTLKNLVFDKLSEISQVGIPDNLVKAEIVSRNFEIREVRKHQGLRLLRRLAKHLLQPHLWKKRLSSLVTMEDLSQQSQANPQFWTNLIEKYLLDNQHRVELFYHPDLNYTAHYEERRLQSISLVLSRIKRLEEEWTRQTRLLQDLEKEPPAVGLPILSRDHLPRLVEHYPLMPVEGFEAPVQFHQTQTLGLSYVDLLWDLSGFDHTDFENLGLIAQSFGQLDLKHQPYTELVQQQKLLLGELDADLLYRHHRDGSTRVYFQLRFSFLSKVTADALHLVRDILLDTNWLGRERLSDSFNELLYTIKSYLPHFGSASRALALLDPLSSIKDRAEGLTLAVRFLDGLIEPKNPPAEQLDALWSKILKSNAQVLWTADEEGINQLRSTWPDFAQGLLYHHSEAQSMKLPPVIGPRKEKFFYPLDNAFNALALPFQPGVEKAAVLNLVDAHLSRDELHRLHREQGGAYGVQVQSHPLLGLMLFGTYRDPRVKSSFDDFKTALQHLAQKPPTQEQLDKTLLGVVGELISPVPPRLRGQYTLLRELSGLDYALRQQIRNQLFEIKPLELSNMAEELLARWEDSAWVSVVGPEIWAKDPIPDSRDFEE